MAKTYFYIDGKYVRTDAGLLDIFTPGQVKYHGVFETMLVTGQSVAYVEAHLERLFLGLRTLRIKHAFTKIRLKRIVNAVVRKNSSIKLGRLRLLVFKEGPQVHCVSMLLPYKPPSVRLYKEGLKSLIVKSTIKASTRYAHVKSLDYGVFAQALQLAKQQGCDEAILINEVGDAVEASRGNIFIECNGQWLTPPLSSGCLKGIMRERVLVWAKHLGFPIKEKTISIKMLKASNKIMMTNSLMGLISLELQS